jgi:SDR family mycofactocin-dependent oxidoreductase
MGLLDGRVALITGGARGQGRAHAVVCAREGADVVVLDMCDQLEDVDYAMARPTDLDETVRQVEALDRRAFGVVADVRSQEQLDAVVTRALDELGGIDILIANAGIYTEAPFWELTERQWEEMLAINLTGVWKSAKAVVPSMIARGRGSIVAISSVNGLEPGWNYAHYVAAKHGLIGLVKNMALELAPHGVRCNAISPGAILTPMVDHQRMWNTMAQHEGGTPDDLLEGGRHYGVLKETTFLSPEVIANAALYLNSDLAAAVTGATLPVDAGHLLLPGFNHTGT